MMLTIGAWSVVSDMVQLYSYTVILLYSYTVNRTRAWVHKQYEKGQVLQTQSRDSQAIFGKGSTFIFTDL